MMEITEIVTAIKDFGFPIFVAVYMMVKGSQDTQQMKETITEMTFAIQQLTTKIDEISQTTRTTRK